MGASQNNNNLIRGKSKKGKEVVCFNIYGNIVDIEIQYAHFLFGVLLAAFLAFGATFLAVFLVAAFFGAAFLTAFLAALGAALLAVLLAAAFAIRER